MRVLIAVVFCLVLVSESGACSVGKNFDFADFFFADVVVEATIDGYEVNSDEDFATISLRTVTTLHGFQASNWQAKIFPGPSYGLPSLQKGQETYLVALGARISRKGIIEVIIPWKTCAGAAILPMNTERVRKIRDGLRN